ASLTERQEEPAAVSVDQAEPERAATVPPDAPTVIPAAPDSDRNNDPVAIEVELPAEQLDRCVQAAVFCGLTVNDWAARVLQLATNAPTWRRLRVASAASDGPQGNEDVMSARPNGLPDTASSPPSGARATSRPIPSLTVSQADRRR